MYAQRYTQAHTEVNFLLGGIGTGCVSLGSRGQFRDFELFHSPGKGNACPYFFFALRADGGEGEPFCRVLESELTPPFTRSNGYWAHEVAGLPRFRESEMEVRMPFAGVRFLEEGAPVAAALEAYSPMIPLNVRDSAIPAMMLGYTVRNVTGRPQRVSVMGSYENLCGASVFERETWMSIQRDDFGRNEYRADGPLRGLWSHCEKLTDADPHYGSMALLTDEPEVTCKPEWLNRGNWDGLRDLWQDFAEDGALNERSGYLAERLPDARAYQIGSLCAARLLAPGEEHTFRFAFGWHYPNRPKEWYPKNGITAKAYYANAYPDAWAAAKALFERGAELEETSRAFSRAIYDQTLPDGVIDRVTANLAILKSPTMFMLADGTFLSWEGCFPTSGCCEGNCSHVFNYAQTLAFLYPELEMNMRRTELLLETDGEGSLAFRTHQTMSGERWDYHPCADGQLGVLLRLYRDWKLTGDLEHVRQLWGKAKKALDFAFAYWDKDGDGLLESQQHNTYDIEFYGVNPLSNAMFLGALRAATGLAEALGDEEAARKYARAFDACREGFDARMWTGEYYAQDLPNPDQYLYQFGKGCLSDQLFGQMLAHLYGLGYLLDPEKVKRAVASVYRHNFRPSMRGHTGMQRVYALNGEAGLVLCSWPHGGCPQQPFIYSDEVWCGVEYQVAAHLIYEGCVEEGLSLVDAVRNRYDGIKRDPFCEVECGNYYIRSLASFALLPALSGYAFDVPAGRISFTPRVHAEDFRCFFIHGKGWGVYRQRMEGGLLRKEIETLYGTGEGIELT